MSSFPETQTQNMFCFEFIFCCIAFDMNSETVHPCAVQYIHIFTTYTMSSSHAPLLPVILAERILAASPVHMYTNTYAHADAYVYRTQTNLYINMKFIPRR